MLRFIRSKHFFSMLGSLFYASSARVPGCPDGSARCIGMRDRPTVRLSRAAERALIERHGHAKE